MIKILVTGLVLATLGFTAASQFPATERVANETESETIFNDRIMPIFRSPDPSSCVQCHLSSVDLKNYILPSHEKTFVSLRDQGLINLEDPKSSKILELIGMGDEDQDEYAKRIHEEMRKAEYEAFADWIVASCADERLRNLPPLAEAELARPPIPNEVIRHGRKSRVINSFVRNVWSQRMRCFPCHTEHEIGPKQKPAREKFEQWQDQYGDQMLIFKETPEATLRYLIEQSQNPTDDYLPLLNLQEPEKSLLVLKPMSKVPPKGDDDKRIPTYSEPVHHVGGLKIHKNDHSHKAFLNWIEDYARVTKGEYAKIEDLPADNWYPTQRILRMKEIPESWPVGTKMQMLVHAKADDGGWSEQPVAFTQGTVTPKHIVNGALILLAPTDEEAFQKWKSRKNRLRSGDYLIKVFVDTEDLLEKEPTAFLPATSFKGQIELPHAKWRPKFPKAEWVSASTISGE